MKQILLDTLTILTRKERLRLLAFTLSDVLVSLLDILFLAALLVAVQFYMGAGTTVARLHMPGWMSDPRALWPMFGLLLLFCLKNSVAYLLYESQCRFRFDIALRLSRNNLSQYLEGNYADYLYTDSAVHAGLISQQPIEFCQNVLEGWQQVVKELSLIVFAITASLLFNAGLFFLLLLTLIPPVLLFARFSRRKLFATRTQMKTRRDNMWQHLNESIAAFVESNLYDTNDFFVSRYEKSQRALNGQLATLRAVQGAPPRIAEVFAVLGLFILLLISHFGGGGATAGFLTLGAFLAAAYKIIPGVARIQALLSVIRTYGFAVKGMAQQKEEVVLAPAIPEQLDSVRFHRVHFSFGEHVVLDQFSLRLNKGEFVGIRGDSGSGKTTIFNLLLGFLQPSAGAIFFNEKLSSFIERKSRWKRIAYVKQQPFLLHDTLLQNIILSEDAFDMERLNPILQVTGLDQLIATLPDGLQHVLAENGKNISGGQRQRVSLARALYKDADIMLLDEPFSELDSEAAQKLLLHLKGLAAKGRMILLISHSDAGLASCDKTIFVGKQGLSSVRS